jgi:hypothetical protein
VTGESKKNVNISSNDLGSFYDAIDEESNEFASLGSNKTMMVLSNILILAMLAGAGFLFFKK